MLKFPADSVSARLRVLRFRSNARNPEDVRRLLCPENIGFVEFLLFARVWTNASSESDSEMVEFSRASARMLARLAYSMLSRARGGGRGNNGARLPIPLSSLCMEGYVFCHDPRPAGPKLPAPWPAPLRRTGRPEATEESPLDRFERRFERDEAAELRFSDRLPWMGLSGSRLLD